MDLTKLTQHDREEEVRVKTLLEMATKKYNMQKELDNLKISLEMKRGELIKLRKDVLVLKTEVPVLERQEEMVKSIGADLKRQLTVKSEEIGKLQETIWRKINTFIVDATDKFPQMEHRPAKGKNESRRRRDYKIRQLKVESEIEAMHSYEKYQNWKMEELKVMRELLAKDSFVI